MSRLSPSGTRWAVLAPVVAAAAAWAIFRPELAFIDRRVDEPFPAAQQANVIAAPSPAPTPRPLLRGDFTSLAHETLGTASVYELDADRRVLRLTGFRTSNGPDVHVYLVKAAVADDDAVRTAGFIDLGSMKGNVGDQTYEIPAGVDLDSHRSISIWCARFSVNFGRAALSAPAVPQGG
ncbi:MAG TPA: DM13 domain-containing protein [Thermoanaerobaculia bacterium]|nr:DM13 domain-containing protein [Thermoanaerobaculia bacterium]